MALALESKDTRLYVRCKAPQKALVEQAAAALGLSVSDYILSTVIERSVREIQRQNRLQLNQQVASTQLQESIQAAPEPAEETEKRQNQIAAFSLIGQAPPPARDGWKATVGMFDDDPIMKDISERGRTIRDAQRSG